jgi:hypothetical protein
MTHTMINTGLCGKCKQKKIYMRCTNCKKEFMTQEEGFKHFKEVKHEWGGIERELIK